uniref:Uncharacterized protein n=1 Tax=Meloidogyne javanica TaxID=6303 RepID=A0A915LJ35_MELJA
MVKQEAPILVMAILGPIMVKELEALLLEMEMEAPTLVMDILAPLLVKELELPILAMHMETPTLVMEILAPIFVMQMEPNLLMEIEIPISVKEFLEPILVEERISSVVQQEMENMVCKKMPTQKSVRFDLSEFQAQISEERQRQNVLFNITERFPGFFEVPERCIPFQFEDNQQIQQNKGFPQVLTNVLFNEEGQQQIEKNEKEARFSDGGSGAHLAMKSNLEGDFATLRVVRVDPVQQDLAFKFMRNILPRKEQQILKIFDQFSNTKLPTDPQINENREQQIVRMCRERLEEIRSLYLEQIEDTTTGRRTWIFAKGIVDIFVNEAWILIPIRKVLDAVNQRSSTTPTSDDVEIIYLCLLWTVALFLEKPSLFKALTSVNAFCVRLAEEILLNQLNEEENIQEEEGEDQNIIQEENKLVSLYLINLNQKIVTKERNPILYLIATKHLDILKKKKKEGGNM